MKFGLETKVGIFVIISIVLLSFLGISFGKFSFNKDKVYVITFMIDDADGLKKGTKVFYRGLPVGQLDDIGLVGNELSAVLSISEKYAIPDNIEFAVRQSGFMGDKAIELVVRDEPSVGVLEDGVIYEDRQVGASINAAIDSVERMSAEIADLAKSINELIKSESTTNVVESTLKSLQSVADNLDKLVSENNNNFNDLVISLGNTMRVIEGVVVRNESAIDGTITNIDEIVGAIKNLSLSINTLVTDNGTNPGYAKPIIANINRTIENIADITEDINSNNGTLGLLINDNETREDVQSIIKGAKNIVGGFSAAFIFDFGVDYAFNLNNLRGYANIKYYPKPNQFFTLGISNRSGLSNGGTTGTYEYVDASGTHQTGTYTIPSSSNGTLAFSLQYSYVFYRWLGLRGGLFENTVGLGLDIYPLRSQTLAFSLEAYDFRSDYNNHSVAVFTKALVSYTFLDRYFVKVGVEDFFGFDSLRFTVGAGIKFIDKRVKYFSKEVARLKEEELLNKMDGA